MPYIFNVYQHKIRYCWQFQFRLAESKEKESWKNVNKNNGRKRDKLRIFWPIFLLPQGSSLPSPHFPTLAFFLVYTSLSTLTWTSATHPHTRQSLICDLAPSPVIPFSPLNAHPRISCERRKQTRKDHTDIGQETGRLGDSVNSVCLFSRNRLECALFRLRALVTIKLILSWTHLKAIVFLYFLIAYKNATASYLSINH